MTRSLREAALADRAGLITRHPRVFAADHRGRALTLVILAGLVGLMLFGGLRFDFSLARLGSGLAQLATFVGLMLPPTPGSLARFVVYLHALAETLAIAFLGTLTAALVALPVGFLAAKNVVPGRLFHFGIRRGLDVFRGVDVLIWALVWINVVGLGPFAGILAMATADFGAFGKLFSEAIEAADRKPVEGVASAGGSPLHGVRFGLLPQVLPVMASQILYYLESNTRSATIIGVVGAGGIGLHLYEQIRTFEWQQVAFLVLMILVTVAVIDFVSARLRFLMIGRAEPPA
ncbi:phosphonate ABC transporter, permease protein PhnE [Chelatococcus sp. SYSU_G07232]|uniref:Phosphonate ABC transporter, permease protein PhnE n=1 Tax=Chelatococcus albus TaxID=3047466 RepID=A0ABT7AIA8_9HYPH|nr:phosphonate ABC transporter, permease protein PhnE [Chelatococcus sp. SYSU_G07232]MDJ1159109.1 phosphonate ABC transporter, permease protein PhnE [Chelatococcus sp. SYSU_G07232]